MFRTNRRGLRFNPSRPIEAVLDEGVYVKPFPNPYTPPIFVPGQALTGPAIIYLQFPSFTGTDLAVGGVTSPFNGIWYLYNADANPQMDFNSSAGPITQDTASGLTGPTYEFVPGTGYIFGHADLQLTGVSNNIWQLTVNLIDVTATNRIFWLGTMTLGGAIAAPDPRGRIFTGATVAPFTSNLPANLDCLR